jgi:hypothetical protein
MIPPIWGAMILDGNMSMLAFDCVGILHWAKQNRDAAKGFVRFPDCEMGFTVHACRCRITQNDRRLAERK